MGVKDSSLDNSSSVDRMNKVARGKVRVPAATNIISFEASLTVYTNNTISPPRKIRNRM